MRPWAFETIALGTSMIALSLVFVSLGAEFPLVATCLVYGIVVACFGAQQQIQHLEAQRAQYPYSSEA